MRRALAEDAALEYSRPSMAEEFEPAVSDVLADWPSLTVGEVAVLVEWPGSRRTLSDLVARVRARVLERARDDLDVGRVRAGRVVAGAVVAGRVVLGRVVVGRVHVGREEDSVGAA